MESVPARVSDSAHFLRRMAKFPTAKQVGIDMVVGGIEEKGFLKRATWLCVGLQVGTPCVYLFSLSSRLFGSFFSFFFECVFDDAWLRGYLSGNLYFVYFDSCYILMILFYDAILGEIDDYSSDCAHSLISPTKLGLIL